MDAEIEECAFVQIFVLVQLDGKEYDVMNVSSIITTVSLCYLKKPSCIQLFAHHLVVNMGSVCPQMFATVIVVGKGELVHKVSHNPSYQAIKNNWSYSNYSAVCFPPDGCLNGGYCAFPGQCSCSNGWDGERCDEGKLINDICMMI